MDKKLFEVWFAKDTGRLLVRAENAEEAKQLAEKISDKDYNDLFEPVYVESEDFPYDATEYEGEVGIDEKDLAVYEGD